MPSQSNYNSFPQPDHREELPLMPEPTSYRDGQSRHDYERNTAGRVPRR